MSKKQPTGFLDLPLELRQMIYGHILPSDQVINFPASEQRLEEETTVLAVCDAHPQIHEEVDEMIYKECDVHITVTPDKEMRIPLGIEFNRFQRIKIKVDHYGNDRNGWAGMIQLISRLTHGHPKVLPDITIMFHEDSEDAPFRFCLLGDAKWTEELPARTTYCPRTGEIDRHYTPRPYQGSEESEDEEFDFPDDHPVEGHDEYGESWLRRSDDYCEIPIAIQILEHFLSLPPCKSATVHPLSGLSERRDCIPRRDRKARIFDRDYMEDMCSALGTWLKGDRDGIEMSRTVGQTCGESTLEQLAYQRHAYRKYVRLYCDCDEYLYSYKLRAYVNAKTPTGYLTAAGLSDHSILRTSKIY